MAKRRAQAEVGLHLNLGNYMHPKKIKKSVLDFFSGFGVFLVRIVVVLALIMIIGLLIIYLFWALVYTDFGTRP